MAIQETAVSYYGLGYVEHAAADFEEIRAHHCTTVILAVTEFEFDFWRSWEIQLSVFTFCKYLL